MKRSAATILFCFVMIVLLLPLIQFATGIISSKKLKGAFEKYEKPLWSSQGWFDGSYQLRMEKYLTQNFGFHSDVVRLNNQIEYSLWKEIKANGVVIGKENYLYEQGYIDAYYGLDYVGDSAINERTDRIRFLRDTLKNKGIDLLLVFAPGKATFFPEFIPGTTTKGRTNIEEYIKQCNEKKISFIDFNDWFIKNKNKSSYPLYPQYGVHWSNYGSYLAADSIFHYIERLRNIDMPDILLNNIDMSDDFEYDDYDAGDALNLIVKLPSYKMAYPRLNFVNNDKRIKPNVLVVADSYYWQIYNLGIPPHVTANSAFWFYNNDAYPAPINEERKVSGLDLKKEIEKQDVIIILSTNPNLENFGWGFIENACALYNK